MKILRLNHIFFIVVSSVFCCGNICAEVVDSVADGFQIKTAIVCKLEPKECSQILVDDFNKWWDASHSYSGKSQNLKLDILNRCMFEQLANGGFVRHMEICYFAPGKAMRMIGALGPLQEMGVTGAMTINFSRSNKGTIISLAYNVTGSTMQNLDRIAPAVDQVLVDQMNRLKKHLDLHRSEGEKKK